jgi:hypothetical protein
MWIIQTIINLSYVALSLKPGKYCTKILLGSCVSQQPQGIRVLSIASPNKPQAREVMATGNG